jgi:tRNA-dihydrouridine synthase A
MAGSASGGRVGPADDIGGFSGVSDVGDQVGACKGFEVPRRSGMRCRRALRLSTFMSSTVHQPASPWRACVAPMMDWTDRHCRYFHRLLSRHARLYTEMVTTGALLHGDVPRHLDFNAEEHPVALQLGGSEPGDLAACARLGEQWGYDEINLNCGCPSPRVQRGAFGACLMAEPALVADAVKAMRDAVSIEVTVKHRIGIDRSKSYSFVRDFVGTVAQAGCRVFIVHARNAWLEGLSPKENREVPPLRPEVVRQLKADFPDLVFVINGGLRSNDDMAHELIDLDGVMVGREAYHQPWLLSEWDARFFNDPTTPPDRDAVEAQMVQYMLRLADQGLPWSHAARHMLGLRHGLPGARQWRRVWSDHQLKGESPRAVRNLASAVAVA